MTLEKINSLTPRDAVILFRQCCGSTRWAQTMNDRKPFRSVEEMHIASDDVWYSLTEDDWKQAFAQHPKIGDIPPERHGRAGKSLRKKFGSTADWAKGEQAGAMGASEKVLKALAEGNNLYEAKFGYIFIVCATGKSAEEMLAILNKRLNNIPSEEIKIAAQEQAKITRIRLENVLSATQSI